MKTTEEKDRTVYEDPAFVTVGFFRQEHGSSGTSLFGSDVKHQHTIAMRVSEAEKIRDRHLSRDWVHPGKVMLEVVFSPIQFSELLTSMNIGEGIPATLSYHNGQDYAMPQMETHAQAFKKEIAQDVQSVYSGIQGAYKRAEVLLGSSKPLTRPEKDELLGAIEKVNRLFSDHLPFIVDQFSRSLSKMVSEAKADVDAFVERTILKTGIEELHKNKPGLLEDNERSEI